MPPRSCAGTRVCTEWSRGSRQIFYEGKEAGRKEEEFIVLNKTAKMIISAVTVPAYVYDADENIIGLLHEFGKNLGFLFQITDDMLDVSGEFGKLGKTVGKDAQEDKLSAVKVYGMENARNLPIRIAKPV